MTNPGLGPVPVREIPHLWIALPDGCRLAARLWLPEDAEQNPVPALIECLPYRKGDQTVYPDAVMYPYFASHGYACVRIDLRGTGDSEGVMNDGFSTGEIADTLAVIDWLGTQAWCSGEVGLTGMSWGGFHALKAAAHRPTAVKAVVAICAGDAIRQDFFQFRGDCLSNENLGWAAAMMGYSSRPPDPLIVGDSWRDLWLQRLNKLEFLAPQWLAHGLEDDYWPDDMPASNIQAPVLLIGGWMDAFVNAIPRLLSQLQAPTKAIIGPWAHFQPLTSPQGPRIDHRHEMLRWWDFWIKGQPSGVFRDPAIRAYIPQSRKPDTRPDEFPGRWISDYWPPMMLENHELHLTRAGLREQAGEPAIIPLSSPHDTGINGGELCIMGPGPEFPGDQAGDDAGSVTFDSGVLGEAIDLFGAAELTIKICSDQPVAQLIARLNDVRPDGTVAKISQVILNLTKTEDGNTAIQPDPAVFVDYHLRLNQTAWHLPKGHKLRLSLSSSYWPQFWPVPKTPNLKIQTANSVISIPIRRQPPVEETVEFAEPADIKINVLEEIRRSSGSRQVDTGIDATVIHIDDDHGAYKVADSGLIFESDSRETYHICADDPLSARAQVNWTQILTREDWDIRTNVNCTMSCDEDYFHLTARLEAYEDDELIFERDWDDKIARGLL